MKKQDDPHKAGRGVIEDVLTGQTNNTTTYIYITSIYPLFHQNRYECFVPSVGAGRAS